MTLFDVLVAALAADDPTPTLAAFARRGDLPDPFTGLLMMDASARDTTTGRLRHKLTWDHSVKVAAKTDPDDVELRLAALLHDIGKPDTRRIEGGEVTFRHHEQVGETIVRELLPAMGCADGMLTDRVARAVGLSGRYKADGSGAADVWSDAAVRRFVRVCGGHDGPESVLDLVLDLAFVDCTSRHPHKVESNESQVQSLTDRIARLAAGDALAAERADLDGQAVMDLLGIGPGPQVGRALSALLAAKRANGGPLPDPQGWLTEWWADTADAA